MGKVNTKMQSRQNNAKLLRGGKTITLFLAVSCGFAGLLWEVRKLLGCEADFRFLTVRICRRPSMQCVGQKGAGSLFS